VGFVSVGLLTAVIHHVGVTSKKPDREACEIRTG
jgi:hypothetical protein